jgi:hypothetical protein
MVLIYPPYPAPFSIEKYFVKRGYESAVSEFELVRKILYVAIPLLIFFTVIDLLRPLFEQFVSDEIVSMLTNNIVSYSARGFLFLTVLAGLLKAVFALSRKRFRLYFAKGCLSIAKNSNDEVEKMEYLINRVYHCMVTLECWLEMLFKYLIRPPSISTFTESLPDFDSKSETVSKFSLYYMKLYHNNSGLSMY